MLKIDEKALDEVASKLFRTDNNWVMMEQHHKPGTPRNLFLECAPDMRGVRANAQEIVDDMRASFKATVKQLIGIDPYDTD